MMLIVESYNGVGKKSMCLKKQVCLIAGACERGDNDRDMVVPLIGASGINDVYDWASCPFICESFT
jgi:hypothetical protein